MVAVVFGSASFAQTAPPRPPLKATPTHGTETSYAGFTIAPRLLKDEGCVRDYLKAQQADGLQRLKQLDELEKYGCTSFLPFVYVALSHHVRKFVSGAKTETVYECHLVYDSEMDAVARGSEKFPSEIQIDGWLIDTDFLQVSIPKMKEILVANRIRCAELRSKAGSSSLTMKESDEFKNCP
jgi:hypothetical protein